MALSESGMPNLRFHPESADEDHDQAKKTRRPMPTIARIQTHRLPPGSEKYKVLSAHNKMQRPGAYGTPA